MKKKPYRYPRYFKMSHWSQKLQMDNTCLLAHSSQLCDKPCYRFWLALWPLCGEHREKVCPLGMELEILYGH